MFTAQDYRERLAEHLDGIETSCREYDQGKRHEAKRIAHALRAMFHQTGRSTSDLTHLNATTVRLLSTATKPPNNNPSGYWPGLVSFVIAPQQAMFMGIPKLNATPYAHRYIPFKAWWNGEPVFQSGYRKVKRDRLILDASNKDGGSHVDTGLPPEYAWVAEGTDWKATFNPDGGKTVEVPLQFPHLAAICQMGYEVLNSPELLKLAGKA
jgi:hypothetical protein